MILIFIGGGVLLILGGLLLLRPPKDLPPIEEILDREEEDE